MFAGPFIVPAWRHDPRVFAVEVALLRSWNGGLVPGMTAIHWIAERIILHEHFSVLTPIIVVRAAKQDPDVQVDIHKIGSYKLPIYHHSWGHIHCPTPLGHILIGVIAFVRIVERAPATEKNLPLSNFFVTGQRLIEEIK